MNLIILTSKGNRHNYFAKKLIDHFIDHKILLIRESKYRKKKIKFLNILKSIKNKILNILFKYYLNKFNLEKKIFERNFFKNFEYKIFDKYKINILNLEDSNTLNTNKNINIIRDFQPDIIVVMGTGLLSNQIIEIPKYNILNLHTGYSPNYRGDKSNFWPIINDDYSNFGATVHELSSGIDKGKIVFRRKINLHEINFPKINCLSIVHGTNLMKKAIKNIINNNHHSFDQENEGKIYYLNDFNGLVAKKYLKKNK